MHPPPAWGEQPAPPAAPDTATCAAEFDARPGAAGWRGATIAAVVVYFVLKFDLTGPEMAAPASIWERWVAVARDHPLRSALALAAFVKASASFGACRSSV